MDFGTLGSKIDQKSIPEDIGKTLEKRKVSRWPQVADRRFQRIAKPGVQSPGEEVAGGLNPSQREEGKVEEGITPR